MIWKNTENQWGVVSIFLHWLSALCVVGMIILGLWMIELSYYDQWYKKAPDLHKSVGICLLIVTLFRLSWRKISSVPRNINSHTIFEIKVARFVHKLMYLILLLIILSGYLISTADGRSVEVFGVFTVPAMIYGINQQEDIAGLIHFILASCLVVLVSLHTAGSLKHHFVDKDLTLKRMLGIQLFKRR